MYRFNEASMFYDEADGIGIVINFTTGIYYSFNTMGTAVLNLFKAGADAASAAEAVRRIDGCPENIPEAVQKFADGLLAKEIIIDDGADFNRAGEISAEAAADGFEPTFDEFSEVQDLIMADPVHDVDPNMGWPVMKSDGEQEK